MEKSQMRKKTRGHTHTLTHSKNETIRMMKFQNDRRACRVLCMCSIFPPFPFREREKKRKKEQQYQKAKKRKFHTLDHRTDSYPQNANVNRNNSDTLARRHTHANTKHRISHNKPFCYNFRFIPAKRTVSDE